MAEAQEKGPAAREDSAYRKAQALIAGFILLHPQLHHQSQARALLPDLPLAAAAPKPFVAQGAGLQAGLAAAQRIPRAGTARQAGRK